MPDSISTFGPLLPSPGYGPAVSCGAAAAHEAASVVASAADAVVSAAEVLVDVPVAHAASAEVPAAAPKNISALRRETSVFKSYPSPRSCS